MQHLHDVTRPECYALSNGALGFPLSLILHDKNASTVSVNSFIHFLVHVHEVILELQQKE
jgi:hypothetical protein